ncbi:MAG: DUF748 domain-containing protein [Nitrospirae bacterium]|nr:DUF748 domain-containing protein [Nitrospirota bacterium]
MAKNRKKRLAVAAAVLATFAVVAIGIAWTRYLDLKRVFIEKLSDKATVFLGQSVSLGNFSFGAGGAVVLYDIVVSNPGEPGSGRLLSIRSVSLTPRWAELARGRLSFRSISISSPDLTLLFAKKTILNISDRLRRLLSEKGVTPYHIEALAIGSGSVSVNGDALLTGKDIDLTLKDLSSREGTKTSVSGAFSYAGNAVRVEGSVYLNDTSKRLNLSVSARDFGLAAFREAVARYRVDSEKIRIALDASAKGDTAEGLSVASTIVLEGRGGFAFFRRGAGDVRVGLNAFLSPRDDSIAINDLSVQTGDRGSLHLTGAVTGLGEKAAYAADVRVKRMDLSRFRFLKGFEISGEASSDTVKIRGAIGDGMPRIIGALRLRQASVKSARIGIEKAEADLVFSTGKEVTLDASVSAELLHLGDYVESDSANARFSMTVRGRTGRAEVRSDIHFPRLGLRMKDGSAVRLDESDFWLEGRVSRKEFFRGKGLIKVNRVLYGDYGVHKLSGSFVIDFRRNLIAIRDLTAGSEEMGASAGMITARRDEKEAAYLFTIKDMSVRYPAWGSALDNADLVLEVGADGKGLRGEAVLSSVQGSYRGVRAKMTSGNIRFGKEGISLDIPGVEVAGGKAALKAAGSFSRGLFPVRAEMDLENIDLGVLAGGSSRLANLPYLLSGTLSRAVFIGTVNSSSSLQGALSAEAQNLSLEKREDKRALLKEAGLSVSAAFAGKDCSFSTDLVAGKVRATVSGEVKGFAGKERSVTAKVLLPETKITELRSSLWDVFPDPLLYAGLDGSLSLGATIGYRASGMMLGGELRVAHVLIEGENGEYSIGPIEGTLPFRYSTEEHGEIAVAMPFFGRSEFAQLRKYYSGPMRNGEYRRVSAGSVRYGFRLFDGVTFWVKQEGNALNIPRFGANIFGGRLNGSAFFDFSKGLRYRAGFLLEGLSLTKLCEEIGPVRGYISGRVDGTGTLKGSGAGIGNLLGKADFWTYRSGDEETKISRQFLQKVAGPSFKSYLGDRPFDKGVMDLYLEGGDIIFRELEISHRTLFGMRDLSVKVAPFNNRIGIDRLLWTIAEAAQRAKDAQ